MKRIIISLVAVAVLAAPAGWASVAGAQSGDPDANGDLHSNCHTGSKLRGAGGEDRFKLHGNGEVGDCLAAPVTPPAPPGAPTPGVAPTPGAAPSAPRAGAAGAPVVAPSGAAVPVAAAPRTTG